MEQEPTAEIQPYPLPLHFVMRWKFQQALPLFIFGLALVVVYLFSFFAPLNKLPSYFQIFFTIGVAVGLLILYAVGSMLFTDHYYVFINRERFERGTIFRKKVIFWQDIADVIIYRIPGDRRSMVLIGLVGIKELKAQKGWGRIAQLRRMFRPSGIIDTIPTRYVQELNRDRLIITLKNILEKKIF